MISLSVNGTSHALDVAPDMRLTRVLRDHLGLTGTKVGCDAGDCGACTVLLDGAQVCACLVPAAQAHGCAVTTVEGLASDPQFAALQRSFVAHGASQCGICTPGMLMAAADLIRSNSHPSEDEVKDALGGVLCRCTGYVKIFEAVLDYANHAGPPPDALPFEGVGARLPKVDGQAKVTGAEIFGADAVPAGCLALRAVSTRMPGCARSKAARSPKRNRAWW
jgi:aldehyde oxidoreductase